MAKNKTVSTGKPIKNKPAKRYTRAQAERAISTGALPPEYFLDIKDPIKAFDPKNPEATCNHPNYHVRSKAWKKLGSSFYDWSEEVRSKFFASIKVKNAT